VVHEKNIAKSRRNGPYAKTFKMVEEAWDGASTQPVWRPGWTRKGEWNDHSLNTHSGMREKRQRGLRTDQKDSDHENGPTKKLSRSGLVAGKEDANPQAENKNKERDGESGGHRNTQKGA